jgi:flagellar motor switch protein FliM
MGDGSLSQEEIDALLMGEEEITPVMHPDTGEEKRPMSKEMAEFFQNLPNMRKRTEEKNFGSRDSLLSQDEIDQMLEAISDGSPNISDMFTHSDRYRVRIYDVARADRIPRSDLRALKSFLSDLIPYILGSQWAVIFGSSIEFRVNSIDELTYEEVSRSISPTSVIGEVLLNSPLKENAWMVYSDRFCNLLLDTILKHDPMDPRRNLTDLDLSLLEGYFVQDLGSMREIMSSLFDLRPRLNKLEQDHKLIKLGRDKHHCVLINYTLEFNKEEYNFDWIFNVRDAQKMIALIEANRLPVGVKLPCAVLNKSVNIECVIQLKEEIILNMEDLVNLKEGDILPLKSLDLGLFTR